MEFVAVAERKARCWRSEIVQTCICFDVIYDGGRQETRRTHSMMSNKVSRYVFAQWIICLIPAASMREVEEKLLTTALHNLPLESMHVVVVHKTAVDFGECYEIWNRRSFCAGRKVNKVFSPYQPFGRKSLQTITELLAGSVLVGYRERFYFKLNIMTNLSSSNVLTAVRRILNFLVEIWWKLFNLRARSLPM